MKTRISAAIRRFIEQHIVADDPYPERSWLDRKDMPRAQLASPVAGLPVEPLPQRVGHGRDRRTHYRVWGRHRTPAHATDGGTTNGNRLP